jgi:DNA-binding response OmpR family regulator
VATVLALDKDALHLEFLTFLLNRDGHKVHTATDADVAFEILRSHSIDLAVVETALSRHDGHRICQQIRQQYRVLPLMIVSERNEEDQIVRGLMEAADDYVTKPVSPHQFLARVRALLRRSGHDGDGGLNDKLAVDEINLNLKQRRAVVNGTRLHLTPRELSLLHALVANHNRVLSRDQLIQQAWGEQTRAASKSVDVHILRLRKKMRSSLRPGFYIRSWRGFGYSFEIPKSEAGPRRLDGRTVTGAEGLSIAPAATGFR